MPYGTRPLGERDDLPAGLHDCPRCGVRFRDTSTRWKSYAPCAGCRPMILEDGDDLDQYRTPRGLEQVRAAAERRAERERKVRERAERDPKYARGLERNRAFRERQRTARDQVSA